MRPVAVIDDALGRAVCYIGRGEEGKNNAGPFIDDELEARGRGWAWCALLVRRCYLDALLAPYNADLEAVAFHHPWLWRKPPRFDSFSGVASSAGTPEPGAFRLLNGLAQVGSRFFDPAKAIPGDAALYHRKGGHHAVIVRHVTSDRLIHTIEGNVGPFPAKVCELIREPQRDSGFRFFATLRRGIK